MSFTTSSNGELSCGFESGEILSWKSDGTFLTKEIYSNNPLLHVRKFRLGDKDGTITFDSNGEIKRKWKILKSVVFRNGRIEIDFQKKILEHGFQDNTT